VILYLSLVLLLPCARTGVSEELKVTFSREGIQPRTGTGETVFLFLVTITCNDEPEDPIEIVINERGYTMKEIDPEDDDFSDGKNFYYRQRLKPGGVVYFFRSGNSTTNARAISIGKSSTIQYHYDVAIIMSFFIVPVIIAALYLRKIEREVRLLLHNLGSMETGPGKNT